MHIQFIFIVFGLFIVFGHTWKFETEILIEFVNEINFINYIQ